MGLTLAVKGHETLDMGYIGFRTLRMYIASSYNEELGELYNEILRKAFMMQGHEREKERWDEICNEDLDLLLWHSDCDGKLTYKECRKISKVLDKITFHCPNDLEMIDRYHDLKEMLQFCAKNRRTLFFY